VALNAYTGDSFQNMAAQLGYGTNNIAAGATYGFNPVSRNRIQLEWAYRGSWVVGVAVDAVADDMTRAGIEILSGLTSKHIELLQIAMQRLGVWTKMNETVRWGRLYGGAIGVMMIDGQLLDTPLDPDRVARNAFKGMTVFDRWMITPDLSQLVTEPGPDAGQPMYYRTSVSCPVYPNQIIHYSRVMRIEGIELPFNQKQAENWWGISILERLYDRLVAYDSTTQGAAQLVYKAHIRTLSIEKLRELIALGGKSLQAVIAQVNFIRMFQANEGITLLDASDKFEAHQYAFSGLGDMMLQFAQQVAGALQIPLVRLLGQAPAGLNATGDSDFRNYYDGIKSSQEARMRRPVSSMLRVLCRSELGITLPPDFSFIFAPLWQMSAIEKAELGAAITSTVAEAFEKGLVDKPTALEELRAHSRVSGMWTSITDEVIEAAKMAPPIPGMEGMASTPPNAGSLAASIPHAPLSLAPAPGSLPPSAQPVLLPGMQPGDLMTPEDQEDGMEPGSAVQIDIDFDTKQVDVHAAKSVGLTQDRAAKPHKRRTLVKKAA
jgi:phage-related protein (TIGR01555 family)